MKTVTIELTEAELATLKDAAREHERAIIASDLDGGHPIFADLRSIREKLQNASEEYRS